MARPKKHTVEYFPHDSNHGKTIFILESRWGNDGYAAWFKILERLGASDNHFIDCRDKGTWCYLAAYCHVSENVLLDILDTLSSLETIDTLFWNKKVIFCQHFVDNLSEVYRKRQLDPPSKECIADMLCLFTAEDMEFTAEETTQEPSFQVSKVHKLN